MAKNKPKGFPQFGSLEELVDFFDSHDLGDYLGLLPEADCTVDLKRRLHLFTHDLEPDGMEVADVPRQTTLDQIERQVAQLSPQEQLKLMARIAEQLSTMPLDTPKGTDEPLHHQREREVASSGRPIEFSMRP